MGNGELNLFETQLIYAYTRAIQSAAREHIHLALAEGGRRGTEATGQVTVESVRLPVDTRTRPLGRYSSVIPRPVGVRIE
jgi:hypothetical protein